MVGRRGSVSKCKVLGVPSVTFFFFSVKTSPCSSHRVARGWVERARKDWRSGEYTAEIPSASCVCCFSRPVYGLPCRYKFDSWVSRAYPRVDVLMAPRLLLRGLRGRGYRQESDGSAQATIRPRVGAEFTQLHFPLFLWGQCCLLMYLGIPHPPFGCPSILSNCTFIRHMAQARRGVS